MSRKNSHVMKKMRRAIREEQERLNIELRKRDIIRNILELYPNPLHWHHLNAVKNGVITFKDIQEYKDRESSLSR